MISAIVITKNEEKNIEACLKSLAWCDDIVVVDDYSTDATLLRVRDTNKTVKIYRRHLNNDFAGQRNFGLSKAKGDWVLFLDADERVSKFLKKEILLKIKDEKYNTFLLRRTDLFLGKELRYGETGNVNLLRLGRKGAGKWERKVHEYWNVKGEIGKLKNPIIHNHNFSISEFIEKINFYSDIHAAELKKEGKRSTLVRIIVWPTGKFFVNYFLKFGFMDGIEGFIMAVMMSFHSFLAWSKLWIS